MDIIIIITQGCLFVTCTYLLLYFYANGFVLFPMVCIQIQFNIRVGNERAISAKPYNYMLVFTCTPLNVEPMDLTAVMCLFGHCCHHSSECEV